MWPQVTDTWGVTYLQIAVFLLVFVLGMPSLLLQMVVPETIRRIVLRHIRATWWYISWCILIVVLVIASLAFIWVFHACPMTPLSALKGYLASITITVTLVLTILFWWTVLRIRLRRETVRSLVRFLVAKVRKQAALSDTEFGDLVLLGEQGEPGYEKKLVLDAFDHLSQSIQSRRHYSGAELVEIIHNIDRVLGGTKASGSEGNFHSACGILKRIRNRCARRGLASAYDAHLSSRALATLGCTAIRLKSESTALGFLEAVSPNTSLLFKLGIEALQAGRLPVAVAALNKLETAAERKRSWTTDETAHLLGLVSHSWYAGASFRRRAQSFLSLTRQRFYPSLQECIEGAREYHYSVADFLTADRLSSLLRDIAAETS